MHVPSREREKNPLVINKLKAEHKHFLDIAPEKPGQALEGTGSLLFDNENKKIFVNVSVRADKGLMASFLKKFNALSKTPYKSVLWDSVDRNNNDVYHTNVVMAILRDHVVLCTESIKDSTERNNVIKEISDKSLNKRPR